MSATGVTRLEIDGLIGTLPDVLDVVLQVLPVLPVLPVALDEVLPVIPVPSVVLEVVVLAEVIVDIWITTVDKVLEAIDGTRHRMVPFCCSISVSAFPLPPSIDACIQVEVLSPAHSHKTETFPLGASAGIEISAS